MNCIVTLYWMFRWGEHPEHTPATEQVTCDDWKVEDGYLHIPQARRGKPDRYIPLIHLKEWTSEIR